MDDGIKIFSSALSHILNGQLLLALEEMRSYAQTHPYTLYTEELESIDENFKLMVHYMEMGADDPMRGQMYEQMLSRLKRVVRNMRADYRRRHVDFYRDAFSKTGKYRGLSARAIKINLENFVSDVAMLQLENPDNLEEKTKGIYEEHYAFMEAVFCDIVTSDLWTDDYASQMEEMLLLPTIDSSDAQMLVSGIMLATMNNFDINKFKALVEVYRKSTDEHIRQKALIGWTLSMSHKSDAAGQREILKTIRDDDDAVEDLVELQKQIIFCMNAEKDNVVIQRDIMPTLIKNSNLDISRFGISEKDESSMEEILDPGAQDRAMEENEEKFQKMIDMQRKGADIYFGGFSQMKRFPFFYSLLNWFCPFNINHPGLTRKAANLRNSKFLENLFNAGPFCDSDKYSFALAMSTIIDRLPENIKEMLGNQEALGTTMSAEESESKTYIRRQALQDLYRFFRLYRWHESIYNPFTVENALFLHSDLLSGKKTDSRLVDLGYFLMKHDMPEMLRKLVGRLENRTDIDAELLRGVYYLDYSTDWEKALECFKKIRQEQPDNEQALLGLAKSAFRGSHLDQALDAYAELYGHNPSRQAWAMEYCIALDKAGRFEEASKILYRLDFQHPGTPNIKRVLAWTLMGLRKLEQAETEYSWLLASKKPARMDYLNAAYCKWFNRGIKESAQLMHKYCVAGKADGQQSLSYKEIDQMLDKEFLNDKDMLAIHGVTRVDEMLMKCVVANLIQKQ